MQDFSKLDAPQDTTPVVETGKGKAKNEELIRKVNAAMEQTLAEDPSYTARVNRLRDSIAVSHTLGFGDNGGLIQLNPADVERGIKRKVGTTSAIVGYEIKNIGKENIPVRTEKFAKNPQTGRWEGQPIDVTLKPGETMNLTRKYMTILASMAEFSLEFANGSMTHSSAKMDESNLDEMLASYYFNFSDSSVKVHSDEVKLAIGIKAKATKDATEATWVVKPEYEADFGFLNNATEKSTGKRTSAKGPDSKAKVANYLQTLLRNGQ